LDIDDICGYLRGLNVFIRAYDRKDVISFMADGSNPDRPIIHDTAEECRFLFRTKILNPKFIEGLKRHECRGAAEMVNLTEFVPGRSATSDIMGKWMYDKLTEKFLLDRDTAEWMNDVNPDARMSVLNTLQEAVQRGLWSADKEMCNKLEDMYIDASNRLEELSEKRS